MTWTLDLGDVMTMGGLLLGAAALYWGVIRRQDKLERDVADLEEDKVERTECIEQSGRFALLSERAEYTATTLHNLYAALLNAGILANPPELLAPPREKHFYDAPEE